MSEAATLPAQVAPAPTPIAAHLQSEFPDLAVRAHAGAITPQIFSSVQAELAAALDKTAVFDLGYRTRLRITGADRLRWLNGMVSNAIQTLPEGHGNYNFILNAQGRIQGDAYIFCEADSLLLDTDRSQAERLFAHLNHFIIMDDVELYHLDETTTGLAFIGPRAAAALDQLGRNASALDPLQLAETALADEPITLVHAYSALVPRYELWFHPQHAAALWKTLAQTGAQPIGIDAVESLRVLEGIPRYGVDITDRHLPQETDQTRALNFTKGCYLGQEIVERIRSRATVHRTLRQFALQGQTPAVPAELHAGPDPNQASQPAIGQLTSLAEFRLPQFTGALAIGSIRAEALHPLPGGQTRIEYAGGTATALDHPPKLS